MLLVPSPAWEREPWEVFAGRRARLTGKLADGVAVFFGSTAPARGSLRAAFRQENNFYYLSGWKEPGAILLLLPKSSQTMPREILYLPPRDPGEERWTGPKLGPHDQRLPEKTGFAVVRSTEAFETDLRQIAAARIYALRWPLGEEERAPNPAAAAALEKIAPRAAILDARPAVSELRAVKSPGEIDLIQKALDATVAAHRAAWRRARPGLYEYQVAATLQGVLLDRGCQRPAYPPIVGAGLNATILHYMENSGRLEPGQLLLMDAGCEYSQYAADITRTIPVSGRFTSRQREIYEIVLGAQKAALEAVKPGMSLARGGENSLPEIAYQYLNTHGKDAAGNPLGPYFTHGLSHHVGLDVQEPFDRQVLLEPGMVITLEPGIYLPEEQIGVRLEDLVLVTATGAKLLSSALPREPEAIERAMK